MSTRTQAHNGHQTNGCNQLLMSLQGHKQTNGHDQLSMSIRTQAHNRSTPNQWARSVISFYKDTIT